MVNEAGTIDPHQAYEKTSSFKSLKSSRFHNGQVIVWSHESISGFLFET
ncbi:hypothetical protein SAMN05661096_03851 [Marivirga sericea]|uniref:Uncharacterized protein n=2 Tax=Marivirga sericea TaxID=1028 RepID=A0A1X7LDX8_9BACT|nr:hypothetical protein SAMN05661096_03851 [Marivirga sericea]